MPVFPCRVLSINIDRPPAVVYAFAGNPANLSQWAAGVGNHLTQEGDQWFVHTATGQARIEFAPDNAWGVMDHTLTFTDGSIVQVPMRVAPNGTGSVVTLTLYRLPGVKEQVFEQDADLVINDLKTLKSLLEAQTPPQPDHPGT